MSVIEQKIVLKAVDDASRQIKAVSDSAKKGSEDVIRANEKTKLSYDSLKSTIGLTAGAFTAISAVAILAGKALVDTEIQVNRIEKALKIYTGSMSGASQEIAFLKEQSNRLGLEFSSTALAYSQLAVASKNTAMTSTEVKDIFIGVSEASSALGLTSYQTESALRAIQQMMSKGTVSAEELQGQLSESGLAGAFGMSAKAMGVSEQELRKMMQRGELMASDLLPKLAKELHTTFGPEAEAGAKGMAGQVNSLKNAFFDIKEQFLDSGASGLLSSIFEAGTKAVKDYSNSIKLALGGEIAKVGKFTSEFGENELKLAENLMKSQQKWKEAGKVKFGGEFVEAKKSLEAVMSTDWVDGFLKRSNKEQAEYISKLKISNQGLLEQEQAIIKVEEAKKKNIATGVNASVKSEKTTGLSLENERIKEAYEIDRILEEINAETTQKILAEEQARIDNAREIDEIIAEINAEATKKELEESNKRIEQAKREKQIKSSMAFQTASIYIQAGQTLLANNKKFAMLNKALAMGEIIVNTAKAVTSALPNIPLSVAMGVLGGAQLAKASSVKYASRGADFVTNGPQMMMVGENGGGRERVQVTPLSSPNYEGPRNTSNNVTYGNISISVQNGNDALDILTNPDKLNRLLKNGSRRGALQGVL